MNDESARRPASGFEGIWSALRAQGYALTNDRTISLPERIRENVWQTYYNAENLHHDPGDLPVDRERARDVIRYTWDEDILRLESFDRITITDRAGIPGERDHARVYLLKDPEAEELVRRLLRLVAPERRLIQGTFGVNLFRTYTNVVTTPHHDHEEYVILYILDRIGDGAETYLYKPEDVAEDGQILGEPILTQQLNPGDMIIFEDRLFKHGTTPLVCPPGGSARRDALICTFDYSTTYLGQAESV
jgi:2OG-Fe dioxygenase